MTERTPEEIAARRAMRAAIVKEIAADREYLTKKFPSCFRERGRAKMPLKLRIDKDLRAAGVLTRKRIKRVLSDYCNGLTYLRELKEGADRIDLDGAPVGVVTAGHAQAARNTLQHRQKARVKARKAKPVVVQQAAA